MPVGSILSSSTALLFPQYIVGDLTYKKTLHVGGHYIVYSHGAHARVCVTLMIGNRIVFQILDTNKNPILLSDDESMPFLRNFCLVDQCDVVAIGFVQLAKIHSDASIDIRKITIVHLWKSSSSIFSVLNYDVLNYIFGYLDSMDIAPSKKRERRREQTKLKNFKQQKPLDS
jgi:hypothetical protein